MLFGDAQSLEQAYNRNPCPCIQGKKNPEQDHQVHHQEDTVDPSIGSVRSLGPNVIQSIHILTLANDTHSYPDQITP